MKSNNLVFVGLAMFTMLFGASNIIYPLVLGKVAQGDLVWSLLGFYVTAVLIPFIGFIAVLLCEGRYQLFLSRIGKGPALCVVFACMTLIGPLCGIPRCMILAQNTLWGAKSVASFLIFYVLLGSAIFLCSVKKNKIVDLLAMFFCPLKLFSLAIIMIAGLIGKHVIPAGAGSGLSNMYYGFDLGYGTMDLLGSIFFAGLLARKMQLGSIYLGTASVNSVFKKGLFVGSVGCGLLALVYSLFSFIGAQYSFVLADTPQEKLLHFIATTTLGPYGEIVADFVVFISCCTTAIVLSSIFADYMRLFLFSHGRGYLPCLMITIGLSCVTACFSFDGLTSFVKPIIGLFYPGLIFLTFINIAYVLFFDKRDKRTIIASIVGTQQVRKLNFFKQKRGKI